MAKNNKPIPSKKVTISNTSTQNNEVNKVTKNFKDWQYITGIIVFTFAVFAMSLKNDFVNFDDLKHIVTNEIIQNLTAKNVITMFTEPINLAYRPLSFLSFSIIYHFFGTNAFYYHLFSLLIHFINIYLVYRLMLLWTNRTAVAVIVSVLFAIHPLHVESVSWASALNDVIYGSFSILSIISYTRYLQHKYSTKYLIVTSIWFVLACLSKPLAIVLPAVFLLMDWYFKHSLSQARTYLNKIHFILIGLVFAYVSVWARNETSSEMDNITGMYGFVDRLFFAFYGVQFYIIKLFFPFGLSAFHAFPLKIGSSLPNSFYATPIFSLALIALVYFAKSFRKVLIFGLLFFLINIALVVQIIPFGETVVAERYTYLSYIGLFYILAQFYISVIDGKFHFGKGWEKPLKYVYMGVGFGFAILAFQQTRIWTNGLTMFKDAYQKYPYNLSVLSGLGHAYIKYDENFGSAIGVFDELCKLYPDYIQGFHSRGSAKLEANDYQGAIEDFTTVLQKTPESVATLHNRSEAYLKNGNYNAVIQDCNAILKLEPNYVPSVAQLGHAYFNLKDYNAAINYYNKHIELAPTDGNTWYFRGIAYFNIGNSTQACNDWRQATVFSFADANNMIQQYCK